MRHCTVCSSHGGGGRTVPCGVVPLQAASVAQRWLLLFGYRRKIGKENAIDIQLSVDLISFDF